MHQSPRESGKGSRCLRRGRVSEKNRIYHVTAATLNRRPVFSNFGCGRIVVHALRAEQAARQATTLAFVVMPDHLHWLLQLVDCESLSTSVARVKSGSARRVNAIMKTGGKLWQDGFYDHALRSDEDIVHIARYIIANPLRANLVTSIGQYALWDAVWL